MAGTYFGSDYWRSEYFSQGTEAPAGAMQCSMSASGSLAANLTATTVAPPVSAGGGSAMGAPRRRVVWPGSPRRPDEVVPAKIAASLTAGGELRGTLSATGSMSVSMGAKGQLEAEGCANRRGLVTRQDNTFWLLAA